MKKWRTRESNPDSQLTQYLKSELLAKLLHSRGVTTKEDAQKFLNPCDVKFISHSAFSDMPKAVARLKHAVENGEHILIWGDFDADGVTSTALLHKTFTKLNAKFSHFIPEREAHGHGLNSRTLIELISKHKVKVVVTVDCGISDIKQVLMLKGLNVDVIITDHHKAPDVLPEAYAIINPRAQNALTSELSVTQISALCDLAGVGVAYKLALALLEEFKIDDKAFQSLNEELLALVAIGTISDIVPLLDENRALVAQGLKCVNEGSIGGVNMLFKECKREGEIKSDDIAFILTPRINAVGRLSKADEAFKLLVSDNPSALTVSIEHLNNNNKIRQSLCEDTFQQALDMIKKDPYIPAQKAILLFNPNWHLGIVGIVASKLVDAFNKPVFLATLDTDGLGRCSARGVLGYSIYDIMNENEALFLGFGGHAMAGGLSFDVREHPFEEIKTAILKSFDECEDVEGGNFLEIDLELDVKDINEGLLEVISKLEPCGEKNPSPVFCVKDAELSSFSFVGKDGAHLKYFCKKDNKDLSCVWWSQKTFNLPLNSLLDIAFVPKLNVFNGIATIQLDTRAVQSEFLKPETPCTCKLKFYDHRHKVKEDILPQISEYLSNPDLSLNVVALQSSTLKALEAYPSILKRTSLGTKAQMLMFFDYPSSYKELCALLKESGAAKFHLMKEDFEEDIDFYIKKLSGMLKYISNKKDGTLEFSRISKELGQSEEFVKTAIKIFSETGSIRLQSPDRMAYLKPAMQDELFENPSWEELLEEFDKTIEFKNALMNSENYQEQFTAAVEAGSLE